MSGRDVCQNGSSKHAGPKCQKLFCSIWVRGSISGNISDDNNEDAGAGAFLANVFIILKERNNTDIKYYSQCSLRLQMSAMKIDELACKIVACLIVSL